MSAALLSANSLDDSPVVLLVGHRCTVEFASGINTAAAATYIQIFDAAAVADVSLGTTVPTLVLAIAASSAATDTYGIEGVVFTNGVAVASTTTTPGSTGAASHARIGVR